MKFIDFIGSEPDVGGPWLLFPGKEVARRSSKGLLVNQTFLAQICILNLQQLLVFMLLSASSRMWGRRELMVFMFVSGCFTASGTDAKHCGQPAETAAWSGTLHCCSYRLYCAGPGWSLHTHTHGDMHICTTALSLHYCIF